MPQMRWAHPLLLRSTCFDGSPPTQRVWTSGRGSGDTATSQTMQGTGTRAGWVGSRLASVSIRAADSDRNGSSPGPLGRSAQDFLLALREGREKRDLPKMGVLSSSSIAS